MNFLNTILWEKSKKNTEIYQGVGLSQKEAKIKSEKLSPKVELPPRNEPKIEEISVEDELKEELNELNLKKEKKDEKKDEKTL